MDKLESAQISNTRVVLKCTKQKLIFYSSKSYYIKIQKQCVRIMQTLNHQELNSFFGRLSSPNKKVKTHNHITFLKFTDNYCSSEFVLLKLDLLLKP